MKLLCLTNIPAVFFIEILISTANKLGAKVVFVFERAYNEDRKHWKLNYEGHFLNPKDKRNNFKEILDAERPDLLLFTAYSSPITWVGQNWSHRNDVPYLMGPHEILNPYKQNYFLIRVKYYLYRFLTRRAKGIITMGNQAVKEFSSVHNLPVISVPYSFDLSPLLKHPLPSYNDEIIFLYSGRLVPFRKPVFTIDIFGELVKRNPQKRLKLIISGNGPLYQECKEKIEELGIQEVVQWENDFEDWYDILNLYRKAHILLALQDYGTWGLIIQEAMAAGLAIVSTNTVQAADNLIINDYNGFLCTSYQLQLLNTIEKYIHDPAKILLHGKRNREVVKSIDLEQTSSNLSEFIKSLTI